MAFEDGMKLANNSSGNAYTVFVLDGFHWIDAGSDANQQIVHSTASVFSALLLKDFLKNFSPRRTDSPDSNSGTSHLFLRLHLPAALRTFLQNF